MRQINGTLVPSTIPLSAGWIAIKNYGFIQQERIVSIGSVVSAPMRRLIRATPHEALVVLTGGERRKTAVVLDSGHVVLTPLSLEEWGILLHGG